MLRIAMVAGEASGDLLAARLINALNAMGLQAEFEGIAGAEMQAAGCHSLFPLEKLSVMGLVEVLKDLPELLSIRRQLVRRWQQNPPDLFIGIDAPDFNLGLAARLHAYGIPTVHYVSPSIWAWREKRVKKIQGHIDLMLTLFPFEVDFYRKHQVEARFVGHPLADEISFDPAKEPARQQLGLALDQPVLGISPGSRRSEIQRLGPVFLQTAAAWQAQHPDWQVVIPCVRPALRQLLAEQQAEYAANLRVHYVDGQSRVAMQAADYLLMASGTAVLEGMLTGRLMVAAYKVAPLTWWLIHTFKLARVTQVTLPNNLAGEVLVPEVLQDRVTVSALLSTLEALTTLSTERRAYVLGRFAQLHAELRCQASEQAAQAIIKRFFS